MNVISTRYGIMRIIEADSVVSRSLAVYGEWAMDELNLLRKIIAPGMCVLDIGAFIGTHTLAFSEFVGSQGKVYSFEPRKEIYAILTENIFLNNLKNVTSLNIGLAEKEGIFNLQSLDINQSINFGGLTLDKNNESLIDNTYQVRISTIDGLDIGQLDAMKIDVEGMERKVLDGAIKSILRYKPIIFCECNSISAGSEILDFCKSVQYEVYGLLASAYNKKNFNSIKDNFFGDAKELALILIPRENVVEFMRNVKDFNLIAIHDLEDLVLPLLFKPQYPHEVLVRTTSFTSLGICFPSPALIERDGQIAILNQALIERDGQIAILNQALIERDGQIAILNQALIERDGQIAILNQALIERDGQIAILNQALIERDRQIANLNQVVETIYKSTSWYITKPLREISKWGQRLMRLGRLYQTYRRTYPGLIGFKRLLNKCIDTIEKGGLNGFSSNLALYERVANRPHVSNDAVNPQDKNISIHILYENIKNNLIVNPTIIFDHNGGGGANTYSNEIVKIIQANAKSVLRVYCFDAVWFIQWVDGDNIFCTLDIEELFDVLSATSSTSIIINSIYGNPDIGITSEKIVSLTKTLNAKLNYKMHDFFALCPSPHLSDFEEKYCGVPQDVNVCASCLKKNNNWYHAWFPLENRPIDIVEWRKPFVNIFEASTEVTFFDESSVEIVRKGFHIEDSRIKVAPHITNYFKCDQFVDVKGALHIGILGTLSHIKGGNIVKDLYEYINTRNIGVPITVVGYSYSQLPPEIKVHGNYKTNDLPEILRNQGVNVILMPSVIPETFSYTISEAMKMGLPIVAFDLGAQGNRMKQYALGKTIPLGSSPEVIFRAIQSVLKIAQELKK